MNTNQNSVFIGLIILCVFSIGLNLHQSKRVQSLKETARSLTTSATLFKDELGRSRAKIQLFDIQKQDLKEFYESELKSIKETYKVRPGNVRSLTAVQTETSTDVVIEIRDTIDSYIDSTIWEWGSTRYLVDKDSIKLNIIVYDSLSFLTYYEKEGLFKPRKTFLQGISHNPQTIITGISRIGVSDKPKRFGLGFQVGYGVCGNQLGLYVGFGVNYSMLRF